MPLSLDELQERLGYRFQNPEFLLRAVTHSSYSNETGERNHHLLCNERLEFLGDSVLSLITSDFLYDRYPELPEGDLTRMRSAMVCEEALATYAGELGLGAFLLLGKGEAQNGGAAKPAILADAFEAVLAAIFLDAGRMEGIGAVSVFLLPFLRQMTEKKQDAPAAPRDSKSFLQEFVQKEKGTPEYRLVSESGPDHNKTFCVEVYLDSNCIGRGKGHSKKHAEQEAARDALRLFGIAD